jgi:hypothetical protein
MDDAGVESTPLPVRPARVRSGRHRRPSVPAPPLGAPPLVLAVPGALSPQLGSVVHEIAELTRASSPGTEAHVGYVAGDQQPLAAVLAEAATHLPAGGWAHSHSSPAAVVVVLTPGPDAGVAAAVRRAVDEAGVPVALAEPLGPHPLLAEVLHERLAEAGLVRADRMRLLTITGTGSDGIVLASTGGRESLEAVGAVGVLLAARLGLPVVPAMVDSGPTVADAAQQLRAGGSHRLALAACVIGYDAVADRIVAEGERAGCATAAPLGAHHRVAELVAIRYLAAVGHPGAEHDAELLQPAAAEHRAERTAEPATGPTEAPAAEPTT